MNEKALYQILPETIRVIDCIRQMMSGVLEIKDFNDIKKNLGYIATPELTLKPADSIEIVLGTFLLDGKKNTLFGQWKDHDQVYLKVKVDF